MTRTSATTLIITHADDSKAFSGVCVCFCMYLCVCLSLCLHDKTKTAEKKTTKFGTGIVSMSPHPSINIRSKGQRSKSQGHKVHKGDQVAGVSYNALYRMPSLWFGNILMCKMALNVGQSYERNLYIIFFTSY